MSEMILKKKKAVIRDWFRLVVWYIRLRRAARSCNTQTKDSFYFKYSGPEQPLNDAFSVSYMDHALLKVERRI